MPAFADPFDEDEYYSDDEGVHKPPPIVEFDMDELANWLENIYPKMK